MMWTFADDLTEWEIPDGVAEPGAWQGRPALRFTGVPRPVLLASPTASTAFTLEAEVSTGENPAFIGLIFGAQDAENYELVYLHPGDENSPASVQYDPVMRGSNTWQIYQGPRYISEAVPVPLGGWVRLRLDVRPEGVAITVGAAPAPQLVVAPLMNGTPAGRIGLWCYGAPCYVASVTMTPAEGAFPAVEPPPLPAGTLTEWLVDGKPVTVEVNGTLNFNRLFKATEAGSVARAAAIIDRSSVAGEATLTFGFSDRLRLLVNGQECYQGEWRWQPPDSDGRIRPGHASVRVPLRQGPNRIEAEVSTAEPHFGWGLTMRVL